MWLLETAHPLSTSVSPSMQNVGLEMLDDVNPGRGIRARAGCSATTDTHGHNSSYLDLPMWA